MEFKLVSEALGFRLHSIAKRDDVPVVRIAKRYVCERVIDFENWQAAFGPAPMMLKGGLLFADHVRPTDDADIQSVRHYSEDELLNGMRRMKDILLDGGIEIIDARVKYIDVGYGDPVSRLAFQAKVGGIRVSTQVDISSGHGHGPDAFPDAKDIERCSFPSFATKNHQFPGYTALAQPLESVLAEKWIALSQTRPDDNRMKHFADLLMLHKDFDVDLKKAGEEIVRVCRYRGLHSMDVTNGIRHHFRELNIMQRGPFWEAIRASRKIDVKLFDAWVDLGLIWKSDFYPHVITAIGADFRRRNSRRKMSTSTPAATPEFGNNVVAFRTRGM